jgi:predicted polyphosphate/ATP-dependent NAD kinase
MIEKNTTHLAGEFLVAGELARRGYAVSLTMGNAKSVDLYAESPKGVLKIDAKAGRSKGNWPISKKQVEQDVYYIFVHLGTVKQIKNNVKPEYFIVTGKEIKNRNLIDTWKTRQGIRYSTLDDAQYKENWAKLPLPK